MEMTIEQKAKAYDEAIEKFDVILNLNTVKESGTIFADDVRKILPELAESEDEKIRKDLISMCQTLGKEEWVAWLEKQGEQKVFIPKFRIGDIVKSKSQPMLDSRIIINIDKDCYRTKGGGCIGFAWEKDYELIKKIPAEVESKFKIGEWIINAQGTLRHIINVDKGGYQTDGGWLTHDTYEKTFHLWTIQDAKDGDVLATLDYILIFKKLLPKDGGVSYCHYDFGCSTPHFNFNEDDNWYFGKEAKVYPATKEQRELLFQKMKEAGYQWDAEIKELRKIEKNPAEWSEEDERMFKAVSIALSLKDAKGYLRSWYTTPEEADNWLKSLKERVQPKQEWSEEDKNALKVVTDVFGQYGVHLLNYPAFIHWLKILPNRITFNPYWRPSDEQMDALNYYATTLAYHSEMQKDLRSLWEDLKKLTE